MPKDYLALRTAEPKDAKQHGVKGMHWGVIRDTATKARDHLKRKAKGEETTPTKKAASVEKSATEKKVVYVDEKTGKVHEIKKDLSVGDELIPVNTNAGLKAANGEETSSARYTRLTAQAKEGRASEMSEQDLKFVNARTQALQAINKMNETDPGWLSKTSKKVLQQAAQNTMQSIADGVAKKYISGPVLDSLNKVAADDDKN